MSDAMQGLTASVTRVVVTLLVYGAIAIPLAGYTWDMLSDLISGHLAARKGLISIPVMIALVIVLRLAARALVTLDAGQTSGEA
jgi:hypothetical protein